MVSTIAGLISRYFLWSFFNPEQDAKVLNLDIAGIDLLFDKDGYKICEANSNPGFSGFEKFCGIDVADRITEYVKYKIQ